MQNWFDTSEIRCTTQTFQMFKYSNPNTQPSISSPQHEIEHETEGTYAQLVTKDKETR